jgi:hypothetical protein
MRDYPDGADLLATARDLLREQLLGALPPELRTAALMVANAMAIAGRQLEARDDPQHAELASLQDLLDVPRGAPCDAQSLRLELDALNRRLVLALRNGDADPGTQFAGRVRDHLHRVQHARLMQSNPRYLTGAR